MTKEAMEDSLTFSSIFWVFIITIILDHSNRGDE